MYISDWETLFDMYIKREEFQTNILFKLIFQQIVLWNNLCKQSKKHEVVLNEVMKESKELFASGRIGSYSEDQVEKASIFRFIKKILLELEVVEQEGKRLIIYFPKMPQCFQLTTQDKKNYLDDCDISDSNTKMLHLQRYFKMFTIQMEMNSQAFKRSRILYTMTSKDSFAFYLRFTWTIGLIINLLAAYWVARAEDGTLATRESYQNLTIVILGLVMSALSAFFLIFWMFLSYP